MFFGFAGDKNEERNTPPCSPPLNVKMSPKTKPSQPIKMYEEVPEPKDNERERQNPIDFAQELEAYKSKQMQSKNLDNMFQKKAEDWATGTPQNYDDLAYFPSTLSQKGKGESRNDHEEPRRHRKHNDTGEVESDEKCSKKRKKKQEEKREKKGSHRSDDSDWKSDDAKKPRKEKKFTKTESEKSDKPDNNPVRLTDEGTFGGIKFKIINRKEIRKSSDSEKDLLLPMKIEKPNEFLSSDDEKPLNYLVKKDSKEVFDDKKYTESDKFGVEIKVDAEDETDENEVENQLIIETNEEPEDGELN